MNACPTDLGIARAITDGAASEFAAHLVACDTCRARFDRTQRAIDLARNVPPRMPSPSQREEMRTAILVRAAGAATTAPTSRRAALVFGVAAAAAVAIVIATRSHDDVAQAHAHGTIAPHPGARYVAASTSPDEIVVLHDGVIDVDVTPLDAGERFRVVTSDAEVEVHGTAFAVGAREGHMIAVYVRHGVVQVRPLGGVPMTLHAGGSWTAAPIRTASAPPASEPPPTVQTAKPTPTATPKTTPTPKPTPKTIVARAAVPFTAPVAPARPGQALAYDEAWAALRANDFSKASTIFARAAILDPDGPLAEDASYWYPVTLARAKRPEAIAAFRDFLDRYPRSTHAGEASAMLGWLLVDTDERSEAERRFLAAAHDPNPAIRDSAQAGLAALVGK